MSPPNEKAARMLDTSKTALIHTQPDSKSFHKQLATLCARAALAGIALNAIEDDYGSTVFIVSRWAMTRRFETIKDVDDWLDSVTGGVMGKFTKEYLPDPQRLRGGAA